MSLTYRYGDIVEFYSIHLLLKNPQIEVHNKTKTVDTSCVLYVPYGDDLLMIYVADMFSHLTDYKLNQ
jgi:hypothetical protein